MKADWILYLEQIGMTETLRDQTEVLYDAIATSVGQEGRDIFVADLVDTSGNRQYTALWVFFDVGLSETLGLGSPQFDFVPWSTGVKRWTMHQLDYKPGMAADGSSRLTVTFEVTSRIGGSMQATGNNCDALWAVFEKWVRPSSIGDSA